MPFWNPDGYVGLVQGPQYVHTDQVSAAGGFYDCCKDVGGVRVCVACKGSLQGIIRRDVSLGAFIRPFPFLTLLGELDPVPDFISIRITGSFASFTNYNLGCQTGLGPTDPPACGPETGDMTEHSFGGNGGAYLEDGGGSFTGPSPGPNSLLHRVGWLARPPTDPAYDGDPGNDASRLLFTFAQMPSFIWALNGFYHQIDANAGFVLRTWYRYQQPEPEPEPEPEPQLGLITAAPGPHGSRPMRAPAGRLGDGATLP